MSRPLLLLGHTGNAFGKHYIVEEKIQKKKLLLGKIVSVQNKFEKQSGFKIILFDPITYLFDESQQVATKKQLHSYVEFLGFSLKVMRGVGVFF